MAEVQYVEASRIYPGNPPVKAVKNLNLDVADGEFLVLVGPSGCGKSTALRMLAGLEDVDEGEIRISGKDVSRRPPKDRDIAMVFQNYALYPHMSVADNMGFALKLAGVSKTEREAEGAGRRRSCWIWSGIWIGSRRRSRVGSGSGWRWVGRSSGRRRCS